MKIQKPEFARTYVYNLLFIIIIIIVVLDALWIFQAYEELEKNIKEMRSSYIEEERGNIRNEVMRISSYIDYQKNKITKNEKSKISDKITELYNRAEEIFIKDEALPIEKIKENILKMVYSPSYNNREYYTLVYSLNKGLIRLGADSKTQHTGISVETIRELIENNKRTNELSTDYLWHIQGGGAFGSINSNRLDYIKVGAIKFFKPLNIFIIIGTYSDVLTKKIQDDILGWIDTLKFTNNQYFFIDKYNGTPLIFNGKRVEKNTISKFSDNTLNIYESKTKKIIETTGQGYIYYPIQEKKSSELYHKISYIKTLNDWGWIVGTGVYMEDIESEINIMREKLEIKTIFNISEIILLMFAFIIVSLIIARFIIKKAQKSFNSFYDFFEESTLTSSLIDPSKQTYREFEMLAFSANKMSQKRLNTEEALKFSENRFKDIAESMADWIWEIDENLEYKYVSGKLKKILGRKGNEFLGKDYSEMYLKDCDKPSRDHFIELIKERKNIVDLNIWIKNSKGERICLQTNAIPFYDLKNNFAGYRGISKDITLKVKALLELERHKENLETIVETRTNELAEKQAQLIHSGRLAALGEMAAGMAHEINQPLSTIKFVLDNLRMAISSGKFDNEYLKNKSNKVNIAVKKISNIINHVRVFSREQYPGNNKLEKLKVKASINNAVQLLQQQLINNGITLNIEKVDSNLITNGDVYRLEQVIINLLSNAKDAVMEKALLKQDNYQMHISVYAGKNKERIEIIVEDNGIGIKPEHLEKVLNPFFTTKEAGKGTGLGLSISYGIIQEMGGEINFSSSNKGTQAIVTLPFIG